MAPRAQKVMRAGKFTRLQPFLKRDKIGRPKGSYPQFLGSPAYPRHFYRAGV